MNEHPSLRRIVDQINENKGELSKPESSIESLMESAKEDAPPKPVENVRDFLTEEEIAAREKLLRETEERERAPTEPTNKEEDEYEKLVEDADLTDPKDVTEYLESEKEEYAFHSIYDLRDFFHKHKLEFDEWAHPAIDSVLDAVKSITSGCKCKLEQRKNMVEDYYKNFITQNQHTSLIAKIKEILKTKKLKFFSREELFLEA